MDARNGSISVVMLPWLAYGHLSPFLEVAKKLSRRNFYIYFCSTPVNLRFIEGKLTEEDSLSIKLVELHLPSMPELPPHYHTSKNLPPHLMPTLKKAFDMASPSFANILKTLSPDLLICDLFQPWAPAAASSLNIPAVSLSIGGAAFLSLILHLDKNPGTPYPFPELFLEDFWWVKITGNALDSSNGIKGHGQFVGYLKQSFSIILVKTFREFEAKYIDYLSVLIEKPVALGPLIEDQTDQDDEGSCLIEWLDKKNKSSAVFVSFGSECFLTKEEMEEIAYGLELSKANFIWAVRFPLGDKVNIEEALPEGFLSRVGERGMVVEGWVPQKKILLHSSLGGFVSHCGLSSIFESMKFGVPIVGLPMQLDQPVNAKLVGLTGVGVEVKRDQSGRLQRKEIAKVIKQVVLREDGDNQRSKAKEWSEKIRKVGEEEMAEVAEELAKLCCKEKLIGAAMPSARK